MLRALIIAIVGLGSTAHAYFEMPRYSGMYTQGGQALPMLDSKVEVTVRGPLVEVIVTQRFTNRADHATEATYIFPLPADAAVSAMWIKAGNKTIRAQIAKRADAQQRYEDAVRAGVVAAVLDQERPDIFTQTVAGIAPKTTVEVTLRYDALAHFYDGAWALAIPMVVAPRYVPGTATSRPTTGTGRAPDTDRAPDASRVTPGGSPGAGGPTSATITFVDKAWDITSPTHDLTVNGLKATFVDAKSDHDAIVRWKAPTAAGWFEPGPDGGFAAVVVEAPAAALSRKPGLRTMLVLDRSASSRGDADALAQPLVRQFLANLDAGDRVAVAGSDTIAWNSPATIQRSLDQSWSQKTGAFDLTKVLSTLRPDGAPIVLVTGGLVADDRAAIAAAKKLGVAVHVIGVGPAPARGLLAQIATATGGTARFASAGDDLPTLARSVITDAANPAAPLTVTWGTLVASDIVPGTLPRLGTGQSVLVLARVKKAQTANARAGGELFAIEALPAAKTVDGTTSNIGPLGRRWARSRLEEMITNKTDANTITKLALSYGLVSPYTSMVAIGDDVVVQGGTRRSIAVPVSVPAGMKWQQVKRETTVTGVTKTEPARPGVASKVPPRTPVQNVPVPDKKPAETRDSRGSKDIDDDDEPVKKTKKKRAFTDGDDEKASKAEGSDEEEEDSGERAPMSPQADSVAIAGTTSSSEMVLLEKSESSVLGRRLRLTTSFAGGFARANETNAGLFALGARLEHVFGGSSLVGVDASVLFVGGTDDVQGRTLLSLAFRMTRFFELGIGTGVHFGAGTGPAGAASLRYHLPPFPRASLFLRYDGALLIQNDERRGQQQFSAGLELSF
jgi:Ca-activated chloride channel family protein